MIKKTYFLADTLIFLNGTSVTSQTRLFRVKDIVLKTLNFEVTVSDGKVDRIALDYA